MQMRRGHKISKGVQPEPIGATQLVGSYLDDKQSTSPVRVRPSKKDNTSPLAANGIGGVEHEEGELVDDDESDAIDVEH